MAEVILILFESNQTDLHVRDTQTNPPPQSQTDTMGFDQTRITHHAFDMIKLFVGKKSNYVIRLFET